MTTFEKEMFGVALAVKKCEPYLKRCKSVRIMCDNLACVLNGSHMEPITVSQRAIRFLLDINCRLSGIDHKIDHIAGVSNVIADAISRIDTKKTTSINWIGDRRLTRSDCSIKEKLENLHKIGSHCGRGRLVALAKEQGIEMKKANVELAEMVLQECEFCRLEKKVLAETAIGMTETPEKELLYLHMDHMEMPQSQTRNNYVFTAMCAFSKFFWAIPVETKSIEDMLPIIKTILTEHPTFEKILADNAFDAVELKTLCEDYNIELKFTSSHSSRQNSVERAHRTAREALAKIMSEKGVDHSNWEPSLRAAVAGYNVTPHSSTSYSPVYVAFNKLPELIEDTEERRNLLTRRELRRRVFTKLTESKLRYVSLKEKIPRIKVGAVVRCKYGEINDKPFDVKVLEDEGLVIKAERLDYSGRYKVIRLSKRHLYELKEEDTMEVEEIDSKDLLQRAVNVVSYSSKGLTLESYKSSKWSRIIFLGLCDLLTRFLVSVIGVLCLYSISHLYLSMFKN